MKTFFRVMLIGCLMHASVGCMHRTVKPVASRVVPVFSNFAFRYCASNNGSEKEKISKKTNDDWFVYAYLGTLVYVLYCLRKSHVEGDCYRQYPRSRN